MLRVTVVGRTLVACHAEVLSVRLLCLRSVVDPEVGEVIQIGLPMDLVISHSIGQQGGQHRNPDLI